MYQNNKVIGWLPKENKALHFLAAGGQTPPPTPLAECPARNASFFYVLPNATRTKV